MWRAPLLLILGPTGSGKSELAHEVGRRRGGEVVSADAFAVYRGFDIGTAKPSREAQAEVPYHLIDVADPSETFSAGRWAIEARTVIEEITCRGKLPVVCGGSGFYLAALLSGLPPGQATNAGLRSALGRWAEGRAPVAHRFLAVNDPDSAKRIAPGNLRYTLRALEILLLTGAPASRRVSAPDHWAGGWRVIRLGLAPSREDLYARIAARVARMLETGWDAEVRTLLKAGVSVKCNAFQAIGYREVAEWVAGRRDRLETERRIVAATRGFVKRQKTWFSRERDVEWVRPEEALAVALARLDDGEAGRTSDE